MKKTHFTRKNFIVGALVYLYAILVVITGLALDANSPVFKANNPIRGLALNMGLTLGKDFAGSTQAYLLIIVAAIYIIITFSALLFEFRTAIYYEGKPFTKKWWIIYAVTFAVLTALGFGIGFSAQYAFNPDCIAGAFQMLGFSMLIALLIYLVIGTLVLAVVSIYINMRNIDKPFRFFKKSEEDKLEEKNEEELEELEKQGELANSFGEATDKQKAFADALRKAGLGGGLNGNGVGANGEGGDFDVQILGDKERVFPGLCTIDLAYQNGINDEFDEPEDLALLCEQFRKYLAKTFKIYFDINTIRAFISGMAASRFIILEGLSGTGKSSLARYFSDFIGEESFFEAVQATWRDRTSILGYYNDFSKSYNETEFLKRLYESNYRKSHVNIMVLDEVNISRVEYYFADFLSIMEYPMDAWKLRVMQFPFDFEAPALLENGFLKIPHNTWFIGTANKDDSTYTITDKVYDRAITISFDDRNDPFVVDEDVAQVRVSYDRLLTMFEAAIEKPENRLTEGDLARLKTITDYIYDTFDLTFGNRIMNQIEKLVPVFVECGGTKEDALDFMMSRKLVGKLTGRFEDYIKQGLIDLKSLIKKTYGNDAWKLTIHEIDKLLRRL